MAVADGYQLWSERYDRELVDVFAVQDEIAEAIAKRLQLTFAAPATRTAKVSTGEIQAYELLVRARGFMTQRGRTILDAIGVLERALAIAPDDPNVHAALGNAWRVKEQYGLERGKSVFRARTSTCIARSLDPNHAEALGHLGAYHVRRRIPQTSKALLLSSAPSRSTRVSRRRAHSSAVGEWLSLERRATTRARSAKFGKPRGRPAQSDLFHHYVIIMGVVGHVAEAVEKGVRACEREPGAFAPHYSLAWAHTWARNTDQGIAHAGSDGRLVCPDTMRYCRR
jgi:serine/threonine-protein kinase